MSDKARGSEPALPRQARVERKTKETQIVLQLNVDGTGAAKVETTIPFVNHMLEAWSKHGLMDLAVDARGDTDVDLHHTVEDVGICLGKAFREALGDKRGIVRYGASYLPMDEALLHASVDISGRPYCVHTGEPDGQAFVVIGPGNGSGYLGSLTRHVFETLAFHAQIALHVRVLAGRDPHHLVEAQFKAFARAFRDAVAIDPRETGVPSTKGSL